MNRSGENCVLYLRVSTEMQVDGFSLDGQKNSLKRFADKEEMIVVDIYEDAGKSGKSIEGRPAFKQMLSDIENDLSIDYVLVYKLSRFGRNAADILNSLEHIQSFGVNLICIEEGIDSSQTSGKLLISVLSAVAEIERENIIEQTMNGRKEKARLENEIDSLPEDARFRERKLHDMTLRLDGLYDVIVELEEKIQIFPCDDSALPLKSILFNFPVYKDGGDVYEFLWDKRTHVSTWLERVLLIAIPEPKSTYFIKCNFTNATDQFVFLLQQISLQALCIQFLYS